MSKMAVSIIKSITLSLHKYILELSNGKSGGLQLAELGLTAGR